MNDTWYDMGLDTDMNWMYNWKRKENNKWLNRKKVRKIMEEKTMIYEWLCDIATTLETLTEQIKGLANVVDLDEDEESEDKE